MFNHSGPDHIQIDIYQTLDEMVVILNSGCVVAILPERTFSSLSYVVFLDCAAGDHLDGFGQSFPAAPILNKKVDVIRCNAVI